MTLRIIDCTDTDALAIVRSHALEVNYEIKKGTEKGQDISTSLAAKGMLAEIEQELIERIKSTEIAERQSDNDVILALQSRRRSDYAA